MAMEIDNRFLKKALQRSIRDLPALGSAIAQLVQETEKPGACPATIEGIITSDQALTAKVLRVVNSAYYGLSGQVSSLSQALVILGLQQVRNLALSVAAFDTLQPNTPRQRMMIRTFWLHAFGAAAVAKLVSENKRMAVRNAEDVFIGSLLHDIGRLFFYVNFMGVYEELETHAQERKLSFVEAERTFLETDHASVGGEIAISWRLPEHLCSLIRCHEDPSCEGAGPDHYLVHAADRLCDNLYTGKPFNVSEVEMLPAAREWLNYTDDQIIALREEVEKKIEQASQMFALMAA